MIKFGKVISFIGMDGAGKTTITNSILDILKTKGYKVKYIYMGRGKGNILPLQYIGNLFFKSGVKTSTDPSYLSNKKLSKKNSILFSLSAPVFTLDLLLRYLFKIIPAKLTYDYIILDRYSADILLINKVSIKLKKVLFYLLPKTNKTFYIYNNVEVLAKRKTDHDIKDLYRQEEMFKWANKMIQPTKVRNDKLKDSIQIILKDLSQK